MADSSSDDLRFEAILLALVLMLPYLDWLVGSKTLSPAISEGLEPKMSLRLANLGRSSEDQQWQIVVVICVLKLSC